MAKRTRGAQRSTPRRPGTRPASARSASARPATRAPSEARGATDTAEEVADARPMAEDAAESVSRRAATRSRAKPSGLLAARAATEYLYVSQDIRRIVLVAALLFGIMLFLWVGIVVMRWVQI